MNDIPDKDQRNEESIDDQSSLNDQTQSDFEFDSDEHAPENDQTIISDQWESETISSEGNETLDDPSTEDIYQTQIDTNSGMSTAGDFTLNDQTIVDDSVEEDINATIVDPATADLERTITEEDHADWAGAQTISESPEERSESVNDQTLVLDESDHASEIGATLVEDLNPPQQIDATIISDDVPPELMATMNSAWGEGLATMPEGPEMTIKADDIPGEDLTNQTALVIKKRDFSDKTKSEYIKNAEYELLEVLGQGGMGVVYTARQTSIDRQVAVKMLKSKTAQNRDQRHKFLAEAVVTGELDHPNIVPIYDVGSNNSGALFYSMKKVEGRPWLKTIRKNSLAENLNILMKVADAVAFAHSRSVVHRDLKPENVMLGEFGEVLVMDWGLARPVNRASRGDAEAAAEFERSRIGSDSGRRAA
ncbi:MAG: serine/threonine protein kinase, partial [Planctomycetaceae bacterium]|nr:serine/threonine protein kinase [Planctomycetaceae bacterium]